MFRILAICVGAHNKLRELHLATPDLQWNTELAAKAQQYAEKLVEENEKVSKLYLNHSPDRDGVGENIYWSDNQNIAKCAHASHSW